MNKDILLCGVGGQGTVLASKLIAAAAMRCGNVVHSAETIGMAQRGGSVTSHIRIGKKASSPLIPHGSADILIAFEPAEAVRNLSFLKRDGVVIVNRTPVKPTTEALQETGYDGTEMIDYLKKKTNCVVLDGKALLEKAGSPRCFNIIVLGALAASGRLEIPPEILLEEMEHQIKPQFLELNKKAFQIGEEAADNEIK